MIYYFSATGNSAWLAREIARGTADRACDLAPRLRAGERPPAVGAGETLGLVFPVHCWAPPAPLLAWALGLAVAPGAYVYAVCTMGLAAGDALGVLGRAVPLQSGYMVKMPANYIVLYNREPSRVIAAKIAAARERLPEICARVRERQPYFDPPESWPRRLLSRLLPPFFPLFPRLLRPRAGVGCTGCGTCAGRCPVGNISMEGGRPVWGRHCLHCMACLQNCPAAAVDCGRLTARRKRYRFPEVTARENEVINGEG